MLYFVYQPVAGLHSK